MLVYETLCAHAFMLSGVDMLREELYSISNMFRKSRGDALR